MSPNAKPAGTSQTGNIKGGRKGVKQAKWTNKPQDGWQIVQQKLLCRPQKSDEHASRPDTTDHYNSSKTTTLPISTSCFLLTTSVFILSYFLQCSCILKYSPEYELRLKFYYKAACTSFTHLFNISSINYLLSFTTRNFMIMDPKTIIAIIIHIIIIITIKTYLSFNDKQRMQWFLQTNIF